MTVTNETRAALVRDVEARLREFQARSFGAYLKHLRTQKRKQRIYQKELQDEQKVGCSDQAISDWERGRYLPSPERLPKLFKALRLNKEERVMLLRRYITTQQDLLFRRQDMKAVYKHFLRTPNQNVMPWFNRKDVVDPIDIFLGKARWSGRGGFVASPPSLYGKPCFGYTQHDGAMYPKYNSGDLLFCDLLAWIEEGSPTPVVVCVGRETLCRMLTKKGNELILKPANRHPRTLVMQKGEVRWYYRVALRLTDEINNDFTIRTK